MFYVTVNKRGQLYHEWAEYYSDTFNPETEVSEIILFSPKGKTYTEKKESVSEIAKRFQSENESGLSWGEIAEINSWFEKMGRRYGLLKEFAEMGII